MILTKKRGVNKKTWYFNYMVEFLDGTLEDRSGEVEAVHIVNAVDKAEELIQERAEADQNIKDACFYYIELDEEEELF